MSKQGRDEPTEREVLGDTDLFFFFLRGGRCESQANSVIRAAAEGRLSLRTSSEVYDDAISAIRGHGNPLSLAHSFVSDMRSLPHLALPTSAEIAEEALRLYQAHGGRRKLSYFDAFHVATAKRYMLTLLTSDRYIVENASRLEVKVSDLADWG